MAYRAVLMAMTVLALACSDSPSAPKGALVGEWGGDGVKLEATGSYVRLTFACASLESRQPLIPSSDGRFLVPNLASQGMSFRGDVTMRGTVVGPVIIFDLVHMTDGTAYVSEWRVRRYEEASLEGICLF